ELVAVKAGGAGVDKVVLRLGPPVVELTTRLPGRQRMVPGVVAISPQAVQVHALALLGLNEARQLFEWPEVIVCVDGRHRVEGSLDLFVPGRFWSLLGENRGDQEQKRQTHHKQAAHNNRLLKKIPPIRGRQQNVGFGIRHESVAESGKAAKNCRI